MPQMKVFGAGTLLLEATGIGVRIMFDVRQPKATGVMLRACGAVRMAKIAEHCTSALTALDAPISSTRPWVVMP